MTTLVIIGLILTIFTGFFLVNCISTKFSLTEKIGLSFPIGICLETIMMLIMDQLNISMVAKHLIISQITLLVLLSALTFILTKKEFFASIVHSFKQTYKSLNLVWLMFIVLIVGLEYANFSRCMYFPPNDRDSLCAFVTVGVVTAQEHTYKGMSLFDAAYYPDSHGSANYTSYAPMLQLGIAYFYTLGAESSKALPGFMFLFFLIAFYGVVKRCTTKTGAAITTFLMMSSPEFIGFSAITITNVIQAVFASLGIIYLALYLKGRSNKDLYLSGILLGLNMWCRTEGIVFIGAAMIILLIDTLRKKTFKTSLICLALSILPAAFWYFFMIRNNMTTDSIAITRLFWDSSKMSTITGAMWGLFKNEDYYGITFLIFAIMLIADGWFVWKKKDNIALLSMFILATIFYCLILYHIDYKWDSITNVLQYSSKRFLFCFVPIAWFFSSTNYIADKALRKLDKVLSL